MIRKLFFILFILIANFNLIAQQAYPNTLLWRITGNGLTKPSYLYGTMHLQDKKLFTFGDSIYNALESSDGFAIEINPVEMMDSVLKMFAAKDNSPLIKKLLSKSEYDKIAARLEKKLHIPADQITTKKIAEERRNWLYKNKQKDDMSTFMDMHLYTIAQNQGKYLSGIEDLEDQVGLLDDAGGVNIEDYIKEDDNSRTKSLEIMKSVYINRDLNKIMELTYGRGGSAFHDLVLIKRNIKMARRMDSLSHIRNSFFAVGAAHLPGDSGLITLLKKRGFIVEPVTSSKYLLPSDYHYTIKEPKWIKVEDENKMCVVEMPGLPSAVDIGEGIPMRLYIDLSNFYCYGISVIPTVHDSNPDSVFTKIIANYKTLGFDIISTKKIEKLQAPAIEMSVKNKGFFYHFIFVFKSNKLFLVIFGAQTLEKLNASQGSKFLNSLVINDSGLNQLTVWKVFSDNENAFSAVMPGKPVFKMEKATTQSGYEVYTYSSTDFSDGSYYTVTVKKSMPGYFIEGDSLTFAEYKKNFIAATDSGITQTSEFFLNGYHGYKMTAEKKYLDKIYTFNISMITRGNRIYVPMVVKEKNKGNTKEADDFLKSFTLLPYQKNGWEQQISPANNFSAWAPSKFVLKKIDSSAVDNEHSVFAHDKNSVTTYSVGVKAYSPYYWSNSDSVFFKQLTDNYKGENDTLISYRLLTGDTPGAELLIKIHNSVLYKKMRALLNGDTLYTLYSFIPRELKDDKDVSLFFTTFKFLNPAPSTIFNSKQQILLAALQNTDSTIRNNALEAFDEIDFTKQDLAFLHAAWLISYPADTNRYRTINYSIGEKIKALNDPLTVDFIKDNYSKIENNSADVQMNMLEALAIFKTEKSYTLLKKLLLQYPLPGGNVYSLSNHLQDSLLLSAKLFPELAKLYADTTIGSTLIRTTVNLLDSNLVNLEVVKDHAQLIYNLSKNQLLQLKTDKDAYLLYNNYVIDILEKLNTKESVGLLKSFMETANSYTKYNAAISLLKLDQPVPVAVIHSLASNNEHRTDLYYFLKKINKTNLFPKEFYSQQKFAEADVYNYVNEDTDSLTLKAVGERTAKIEGHLKRYYLFRLNTFTDDEKDSHLVICGPFEINKLSVEAWNDEREVQVFYDEKYNPASTEKLFRQFVNDKINGDQDK